jgi:hypothetical protein
MVDKNGDVLKVADRVRIFTYTHAVIIDFEKRNGEDVAIVSTKNGTSAVYSEEVKLGNKGYENRTGKLVGDMESRNQKAYN